mmetsp:Transcript_49958/g.140813  ORF Transcript_49958/g.140813 Transcript_49958/m.140813 type:complete len:513 (+) Transcript_49958:68-1606(+)
MRQSQTSAIARALPPQVGAVKQAKTLPIHDLQDRCVAERRYPEPCARRVVEPPKLLHVGREPLEPRAVPGDDHPLQRALRCVEPAQPGEEVLGPLSAELLGVGGGAVAQSRLVLVGEADRLQRPRGRLAVAGGLRDVPARQVVAVVHEAAGEELRRAALAKLEVLPLPPHHVDQLLPGRPGCFEHARALVVGVLVAQPPPPRHVFPDLVVRQRAVILRQRQGQEQGHVGTVPRHAKLLQRRVQYDGHGRIRRQSLHPGQHRVHGPDVVRGQQEGLVPVAPVGRRPRVLPEPGPLQRPRLLAEVLRLKHAQAGEGGVEPLPHSQELLGRVRVRLGIGIACSPVGVCRAEVYVARELPRLAADGLPQAPRQPHRRDLRGRRVVRRAARHPRQPVELVVLLVDRRLPVPHEYELQARREGAGRAGGAGGRRVGARAGRGGGVSGVVQEEHVVDAHPGRRARAGGRGPEAGPHQEREEQGAGHAHDRGDQELPGALAGGALQLHLAAAGPWKGVHF